MNFWITRQDWQTFQEEKTTAHGIYSSGLFRMDRYEQDVLVSRYSQEDPAPLLEELAQWSSEVAFAPRNIYLKDLVKNPTATSIPVLLKGTSDNSHDFPVLERGLSFQVDLTGGYSTGLFIDQRLNRKTLTELKPKQVLNCFSYTCAFSVVAAAVGASTTSIDLAGKCLERGKENFALNHLPLEGHYFIADDVRSVLPRLHRKGLKFDAIILDPPTFARSKKGAPFKVEKEFPHLIEMALDCAMPHASILLSTNSKHLSTDDLVQMGEKAIATRGLKAHYENGLRPHDIDENDMPSTVWLKLA